MGSEGLGGMRREGKGLGGLIGRGGKGRGQGDCSGKETFTTAALQTSRC